MGPPSLNGGNVKQIPERRASAVPASMGPPSLNGGNLVIVPPAETHRLCFNGAAVSQRRKPAAGTPRWMSGTGCFNGAAVSQRRKRQHSALDPGAPEASMGPPSLNGGNGETSSTASTRWSGFNGAAVSQRRKPRVGAPVRPQPARFNGAAVSQRRKRRARDGRAGGHADASMGPPSLNGGNRPQRGGTRRSRNSFNGAAVSQRRKPHTGPSACR